MKRKSLQTAEQCCWLYLCTCWRSHGATCTSAGTLPKSKCYSLHFQSHLEMFPIYHFSLNHAHLSTFIITFRSHGSTQMNRTASFTGPHQRRVAIRCLHCCSTYQQRYSGTDSPGDKKPSITGHDARKGVEKVES